MIQKVTFITPHAWKSNRLGGFHKFAERCCREGIETVFFSFPRPYYGLFQRTELYNRTAIRALQKGVDYRIGNHTVHNITIPTMKLPNGMNRLLSNNMMNALSQFSFSSFKKFAARWLDNTDVFIFESAEGIVLIDRLKKMYPKARFVYRPSDPLMYDGALSRYSENEAHIMTQSDLTIIVNEEGLELYRKKIPHFDAAVRYTLLSNGVDIDSYTKNYPVPLPLQKQNTVLYVGAWEVEWDLLFTAAAALPKANFIVVCPNYPNGGIQSRAAAVSNLTYVPGIPPDEVPAWITNCTVVMVPYVTDFYKNRPLGITAKYYQAMAAKKPIVAYCDTPKLSDAGIKVAYTYADFIGALSAALTQNTVRYNFDLSERTWEKITARFMTLLQFADR